MLTAHHYLSDEIALINYQIWKKMFHHWLKIKCCSLAFWDDACYIKSAISGMYFKWDLWGVACGYNQGWSVSLSLSLSPMERIHIDKVSNLENMYLPQETKGRERWVPSTTLYPLRYVYWKPIRSLSLLLAIKKGFQRTKVCLLGHFHNPYVFTLQKFRVLILDWMLATALSTLDILKLYK